MLTAVVGINWGDEGKGRMVDLFSADHDIIIRYQGGNNAGHTVVNDRGKFVLNLLPSGILRPGTVNVLGPGMVLDLEHLTRETAALREKGVSITPDNLKISDRATICMPYHRMMDILEEDRLADKKFGSTRRGIGPVYADKYTKKTLRTGDLLFPEELPEKLADLVEWKNITVRGYGHEPVAPEEMFRWLEEYALPWRDYLVDTTEYLPAMIKEGHQLLFEAQLGALRDIDFGIYPYTSSSSTIAAYAPIGAGIPARRLDRVDPEEVRRLAAAGAQVLHPRSAELAERFRVPLRVLSSMKEGPGTAVTPVPLPPGEGRLTAAACRSSLVTVVGSDLRARPFSPARRAAEALEEAGIRPEGSLETDGYLAVKVPPERAADALRCLHRAFFEEGSAPEESTAV